MVFIATAAFAADVKVDLEVAVADKVPFGTHQRWYELLQGVTDGTLRIRAASKADEAKIEQIGSTRQPRYKIIAVLTARQQLVVPGANFDQRSIAKFKQYIQTLREEGVDGVTGKRGMFGLTEQQFEQVLADLSEPIGVSTVGKRPREIASAITDKLKIPVEVEQGVVAKLDQAPELAAELKGFSRGTVMAILFRQADLQFVPRMRGGTLHYYVYAVPKRAAALQPRPANEGKQPQHWPVGWEIEGRRSRVAPKMFEIVTAEIGGYTLGEAIDAIAPRTDLPFVIDAAALAERRIDPAKITVKLPRGRFSYDRILQRILHQAKLQGDLREDERGTVFYWISAN